MQILKNFTSARLNVLKFCINSTNIPPTFQLKGEKRARNSPRVSLQSMLIALKLPAGFCELSKTGYFFRASAVQGDLTVLVLPTCYQMSLCQLVSSQMAKGSSSSSARFSQSQSQQQIFTTGLSCLKQ